MPIRSFPFNDKESVTADPTRPGTAYVVWDRLATVSCGPARPSLDAPSADSRHWAAQNRAGGAAPVCFESDVLQRDVRRRPHVVSRASDRQRRRRRADDREPDRRRSTQRTGLRLLLVLPEPRAVHARDPDGVLERQGAHLEHAAAHRHERDGRHPRPGQPESVRAHRGHHPRARDRPADGSALCRLAGWPFQHERPGRCADLHVDGRRAHRDVVAAPAGEHVC